LFYAGSLKASVNLWQLAGGHIRFRKLHLMHSFVSVEQSKIESYLNAFSRSEKTPTDISSGPDLYDRFNRILRHAFAGIPPVMVLEDVTLQYAKDSVYAGICFNLFRLSHGKFESDVQLVSNSMKQQALIKGSVKPRHRNVEITVNPKDEGVLLKSAAASLTETTMLYKSLSMSFVQQSKRNNELTLQGNYTLDFFEIYHKTISSDTIIFPGCSTTINFTIGTNYLVLDSISEIRVGKLTLHPYMKYIMDSSDTLAFSCSIPTFTVDDFNSSLPAGLFPNLKGIIAEGKLSYRAKLQIDLDQPDSLRLESILKTDDFRLNQINAELLKMNNSFLFTAYEKGKPVRNFLVGPDNPEFCPVIEVPSLLQNAILIAEDGSFYSHNGFLPGAIRRAIAENIREKKLYRGGSTISQQLVKNVYLSREKTLSRKLEEVILVWLIESNRLVAKSRMFEVYLNIIEWGPDVYGVSEASRFYFNKEVGNLSASECIFLASVIPSPKKFYWRFDEQGRLAPFMLAYYTDMSEKMFNRGLLPSANGDSLAAMLNISGPAKEYLQSDTLMNDTIQPSFLHGEDLIMNSTEYHKIINYPNHTIHNQ
jgi:hypothetical protein